MVRIREAAALLTRCITLWIGPVLGAVERACILSWMRQGHQPVLYCYARPAGIPAGAEVRDASEILPEHRVIRHRSGSASLFSNLFRYELQRRGAGTWVDSDVYLLKPIGSAHPYLLAEQAPGIINGSVLRLPQDSPLLPPLLALFEETRVPPWLPWRAKAAARWRLATTRRAGLDRMPWGSAGPLAITALARAFGLDRLAEPPERFHPVPWERAEWIRDPLQRLESVIGPGTVGVHLWNERIKAFKDEPAPKGSFLARLQEEGGAHVGAGAVTE